MLLFDGGIMSVRARVNPETLLLTAVVVALALTIMGVLLAIGGPEPEVSTSLQVTGAVQ